jgi:ribosomal protein S16
MVNNKKILRLRRKGRKNYKVFDIVVTKSYKRNRSDFLDKLGFANFNYFERLFFIDIYKLGNWLNKGVFLHNTIKKYLSKFIFMYV